MVRGVMATPPNSNLAASSASDVESEGSGAETVNPSRRPASAKGSAFTGGAQAATP